jgi:hypothetical protein
MLEDKTRSVANISLAERIDGAFEYNSPLDGSGVRFVSSFMT